MYNATFIGPLLAIALELLLSSTGLAALKPVLRCTVSEDSALYVYRHTGAPTEVVAGYREISSSAPESAAGLCFHVVYVFDKYTSSLRPVRVIAGCPLEGVSAESTFLTEARRHCRKTGNQWTIKPEDGSEGGFKLIARPKPGSDLPLKPVSLEIRTRNSNSGLDLGQEYFNPSLAGATFVDFDGDGKSELVLILTHYRAKELIILAETDSDLRTAQCPNLERLEDARTLVKSHREPSP